MCCNNGFRNFCNNSCFNQAVASCNAASECAATTISNHSCGGCGGCNENRCGNGCNENRCGNGCNNNRCGNGCDNNRCGNGCNNRCGGCQATACASSCDNAVVRKIGCFCGCTIPCINPLTGCMFGNCGNSGYGQCNI